ncbi:MAG: T9SS type A sorting domain-containing protein [Flavobacteriaceae bacterium]
MKKILLFLSVIFCTYAFGQIQDVTYGISPSTFDEDDTITITIDGTTLDEAAWGVNDRAIFIWAWSYDLNDANSVDCPTNGTWNASNGANRLTYNSATDEYWITFVPTTFFSRTDIGRIGFLFKASNGDGDKKTPDYYAEVGSFQLTRTAPTDNTTIISSGQAVPITATTTLAADFTLKANGVIVNSSTSSSTSYSYTPTVTESTFYELEASDGTTTVTSSFQIIVTPTVTESPLPATMEDGINYNTADHTKATLVFYAPMKNFVHFISSINDWQVNDSYLLNKDSSKDRFWIELTGLTPQTDITFQYLIDGTLRVADPYSTTVLTESNDQFIDNTTYPNLPAYPTGKTNHAVSLLRTGDTPYNWQVTNFTAPAKKDLVIYELLVRDFDALHSFDAVKSRLDYLQTLGINAIEFMPLNEFDGNLSWGYNPSFHMALDKYYGTPDAFKQLIDECHARGIAVIVDVVYNHATGQHPFYRMWNTDDGGYGGQASGDSPFFNAVATHPFNVFNDFNHEAQATKDYVKRTVQYWINEYKIDGMRWDLSKGFTQQSTTDVGVWGSYQADRIAILKEYADYQWDINPDFYVILEHFADHTEETELINYRLGEGTKGMMVWGNHNHQYNEATMGFHDSGKSDFSWISYINRGWTEPANVSFMESHDEQRLMYKNLQFGNSNGSYDITNLSTALDREELAGAFYFTIPGPKMIWQFGELGYDIDIDFNGRTGEKPILWNYFDDPDRKAIYNTWSSLIQLKKDYDIFRTNDFTLDVANANGLKKIHLTDNSAGSSLQYVTIIGNFGVTTQNISPAFQQTGTWYDLLNDNTTISVANVNSNITLQAGEFKVYGSSAVTLSSENNTITAFSVYPNPASNMLQISNATTEISIYNLLGKKVLEYKGVFEANHSFNIEHLSKGMYILQIQNKGKTISKKLIKN